MSTFPPIEIHVSEVMPAGFYLTVPVRIKGTWRIKVGGYLVRLAARVLGSEGRLEFLYHEGESE